MFFWLEPEYLFFFATIKFVGLSYLCDFSGTSVVFGLNPLFFVLQSNLLEFDACEISAGTSVAFGWNRLNFSLQLTTEGFSLLRFFARS